MKYIYTVHIVNIEGRHSYYSTGICAQSIPFALAQSIEFLQINIRSKEKKNFFPQFRAFQLAYKELYSWRHSLRTLFTLETTGSPPPFSFQKRVEKYIRLHP